MDLPGDVSPLPDRELEESIRQGKETRRRVGKVIRIFSAILIAFASFNTMIDIGEVTGRPATVIVMSILWFTLGLFFSNERKA